jgi:tRNA 2-thiouridine synthesizing protein A
VTPTGNSSGTNNPSGTGDDAGSRAADQGQEPDEVLDCRGQRCPLPVIALARRMAEVPIGTVIRLLADDPAAPNDIAAWSRMRAQQYLGSPAPHILDIRRLT